MRNPESDILTMLKNIESNYCHIFRSSVSHIIPGLQVVDIVAA